MPELPEVETIKRQLQKSLKNHQIRAAFVYKDKMIKLGAGKISNIKSGSSAASDKFVTALRSRRVLTIDRRAKYLVIKLSAGLNLMIHLRMSGQLIIVKKKDLAKPFKLSLARTAIAELLPSKHSHVEFQFTNGDKLFYNDTRQFGHIRLVTDQQLAKVFEDQDFGPEPLTLKFPQFKEIVVAHKNKRAKDFLLNQSVIAGIGNIYADESLFISRIDPLRKVGTLKEAQTKKLFISIQKVLAKAISLGGSSIEYYLMTNGSAGKFSEEHLVYAKAGKPCPNCGRPLKSQKIGSRTSTFCSHCQK